MPGFADWFHQMKQEFSQEETEGTGWLRAVPRNVVPPYLFAILGSFPAHGAVGVSPLLDSH